MSDDILLLHIVDGCATIILNRPQAMNALSNALRRQLVDTLTELDQNDDVQVIILTGTGRAFCAGLDVKELNASDTNVTENIDGGDIGGTISALSKPIIAAINGAAVTGGFEIALSCDIIFAAQSAYFADTHVKIGLLPGWGLSQRLSRTIGPYLAKEISLSARKISAEEAARFGFVNRVLPDDELMPVTLEMARSIAGWKPANIKAVKSLIDDGYALPFGEALPLEVGLSRSFNSKVVIKNGN